MLSTSTIPVKDLYRDDDVSVHTDAYLFKELHKWFIKNKKVHTAAVIMDNLWDNQAMFWYLATAPYLNIGLHGWNHKDYSSLNQQECEHDIIRSLDYWDSNYRRMLQTDEITENKRISIFFSPWNRESIPIRTACANADLRFCNVRKGFWEDYYVRSFHWWNIMDDDWRLK